MNKRELKGLFKDHRMSLLIDVLWRRGTTRVSEGQLQYYDGGWVTVVDSKMKSAYVIHNTEADTLTKTTSWTVLGLAEQMGLFRVTAIIRNKADNSIKTLRSRLSYDYVDVGEEVSSMNEELSDAAVSLTAGIDSEKKLFATLSGMATDAKRVFFCFERCVAIEQKWILETGAWDDEGVFMNDKAWKDN